MDWELDYKENWVPNNWCFWTVVLEKILESPLDHKENQSVNSEGNQSWMFIERTDSGAQTRILWSVDVKNLLIAKDPDAGKYWRQEEKEKTEDEMVGWHHQLMDVSLSNPWELAMDRETWRAPVRGVAKCHKLSEWTEDISSSSKTESDMTEVT